MREPRWAQAREKRELAALIRRYAAGLEPAERQDLMVYADSIEAEADVLGRPAATLLDEPTAIGKSPGTYDSLKASTDSLFEALLEALKAVDYRVPDFAAASVQAQEAYRTVVRIAHVSGTPEARYLVLGSEGQLELHVQLNVYRLAVVYRIPAQRALDSAALQARFAHWAMGAADAGWTIRWREASDEARRTIEVSCHAGLPIDFLQDERHQLYWITELVQMTRVFLLEAGRAGVQPAAA